MRDKGDEDDRGPATVLMTNPRVYDPANAPDTARTPGSAPSSAVPSSVEPPTVPRARGTQPLQPVVKTSPMALAVPLAPVITTAAAVPGGSPLPYVPAAKGATMIMPAVPLPAPARPASPPTAHASTVLIPPALPIEPVAPIVLRPGAPTDSRGSAPPSLDMALRPTAPVEEAVGLPPLPPPLPPALPDPLPAPIFDQETAAASLPRLPAPPQVVSRPSRTGRRVAITVASLILLAIVGAVASVALGFVQVPWRKSPAPKKTATATVIATSPSETPPPPPTASSVSVIPASPSPSAEVATSAAVSAPIVVSASAASSSASAEEPPRVNWLDAPSTPADGLLSFQGYLTVDSKLDADVYVNGVNAGRTNSRFLTKCGDKNVRLKAQDGWKTAGAAVRIVCMRHTTIRL